MLPYALFLAALPFVNRVTPTVLGLPFLFFWMLLATLLTPAAVWLARRGDLRRGYGRNAGPAGGEPAGGGPGGAGLDGGRG
ncbi:hypothetical protein ADL22_10355 [Streptomyces sp. NRRL F-4489]|nr:hypothetical protein ADL22_10355 [Streptomyces sp. NRRL F-4489]